MEHRTVFFGHSKNRRHVQSVPVGSELRYPPSVKGGEDGRKEPPMNVFAKILLWLVLSSFVAAGARASNLLPQQQDVRAARLVICDTAEKAQHFATLHQDIQAAIADNNDATNKVGSNGASISCLVAGIAYISGKQLERVQNNGASYHVTEILIVGVATPYGFLAIKPSVVYTLLKVEDEAA
jgi:hypothetical protein